MTAPFGVPDRSAHLPVVVLIGGASGTGKSMIALEIARRCGVGHVISTDALRRALRRVHQGDTARPIHCESFDVPGDDAAVMQLAGFINQAHDVVDAAHAVVEHALLEGWAIVVEGVHLVPGMWPDLQEGSRLVQVVVSVDDVERHAANFRARGQRAHCERPADHYLHNVERIRGVQGFLKQAAKDAGVPVVETSDPEAAVLAIMHLVREAVDRT